MANITVKYFSGCMALREALATMFHRRAGENLSVAIVSIMGGEYMPSSINDYRQLIEKPWGRTCLPRPFQQDRGHVFCTYRP